MSRYRIMVVTTSRADYGLLFPLIRKMKEDEFFDVKLAVTGSHLSELHGKTAEQIEKDGLDIDVSVDMRLKGDLQGDICFSIAEGMKGFSSAISELNPDIIIVLGDRYELWCVCMAAVIHRIPIAHIHGGEVTYGALDESVRHTITKMSAIHFPSIELYGKRVVQMGENPDRVHVVGALGIDNIKAIELDSPETLSFQTGVDFKRKVALMTYHPVTLDDVSDSSFQVQSILDELFESELFTLITMPNADAGSMHIYEVLQTFAGLHPDRFKLIKNLGQKRYLSAMKYSALMIGNSSSGIIESASFGLPVVNIGDRQGGRFRPGNVIDCECSRQAVGCAIEKALLPEFRQSLYSMANPYGDGKTSDRILEVLKRVDLSDKESLLKKKFYDINFL